MLDEHRRQLDKVTAQYEAKAQAYSISYESSMKASQRELLLELKRHMDNRQEEHEEFVKLRMSKIDSRLKYLVEGALADAARVEYEPLANVLKD